MAIICGNVFRRQDILSDGLSEKGPSVGSRRWQPVADIFGEYFVIKNGSVFSI
jgi:hypothetical protein